MKKEDLIKELENMELPQAEMPGHKQRLKKALLASRHFEEKRGGIFESMIERFGGLMNMNSRVLKVAVPLVSLVFVVALLFAVRSHAAITGSHPAAFLTLQVNPALQLELDSAGKVIGVKNLNDDGQTILSLVDVQNKDLKQALQIITEKIIAQGFLKKDAKITISLRAAPGVEIKALPSFATEAREAVAEELSHDNRQAKVVSIVVDEKLYDAACEEGVLPDEYSDLVEAGVSPETIQALIDASKAAGVDQAKLDEEFDKLAEAFVGMREAGIKDEAALATIKSMLQITTDFEKLGDIAEASIKMQAAGITTDTAAAILKEAAAIDPSLEKVGDITEAFVKLVQSGLSETDALNKIKEVIAANPNLDDLGDLLNIGEQDEDTESIDAGDEASDKDSDKDEDKDDEDDRGSAIKAPRANSGFGDDNRDIENGDEHLNSGGDSDKEGE